MTNLNRRSMLALLGVSPIVGPTAARRALSGEVATGLVSNSMSYGAAAGPPSQGLTEISSLISGIHSRWDVQQRVASKSLPWHIEGRRSWSTAFKSHVFEAEYNEEKSLINYLNRLDESGALRVMKLLGIKP